MIRLALVMAPTPGRPDLMYLLDTNVVAELRKAKAGKADKYVMAWASNAAPANLFLSTITVLEMEHGMIVVTRNVADFAATAVTTLNPWKNAIVAAR